MASTPVRLDNLLDEYLSSTRASSLLGLQPAPGMTPNEILPENSQAASGNLPSGPGTNPVNQGVVPRQPASSTQVPVRPRPLGMARRQALQPNPLFSRYAEIMAKQPPENRSTYANNLHKSLTDSFLQAGKMTGPDGRVYRVHSQAQVGKLVEGWIKDSFNQYAQKFPNAV